MENTSRHINTKFGLVSQLIAKLPEQADSQALRIEYEAISARYALCTSHLFLQSAGGETGRIAARDAYQRVVASENFVGDLDHIVARIKTQLKIGDREAPVRAQRRTPAAKSGQGRKDQKTREFLREVQSIIDQYSGYKVDCTTKTVQRSTDTHGATYNICAECQAEMAINSETSELTCMKCGKVRQLVGTVFDDAQFYNQEGQKAKSGSFNPNRHYRFWMDHILSREPEEELGDKDDPDNTCGEKLLSHLREIVKRDKKILQLLTVDDIRAMLREVGRTDLNKNVPTILRRLTGIGPPSLPETICQRAEKLFTKAIEIGERIRSAERTNRSYYPYYIYKILDSLLPDESESSDAREHRRVLYYIYMQGEDTLDKNDREWKDICAELPEITWTSTNRSKALKYRP